MDSNVSTSISNVNNITNSGNTNKTVRFNVIIRPHRQKCEASEFIPFAGGHFHLDRTALWKIMEHFPTLQDLLDRLQESTKAALDGYRLELAVANFCDY